MRAIDGQSACRVRGFSLVELVIVVVILGVIAAIAIPRLSRGSEGAATSAVKHNLAILNKAVDLYAAEHGNQYPRAAKVSEQLLMYTDAQGNTSAVPTSTHVFGPYLRKIPPAPAGEAPGSTKLSAVDAPDVGWLYVASRGRIYLNRGTAVDTNSEDTALNNVLQNMGL